MREVPVHPLRIGRSASWEALLAAGEPTQIEDGKFLWIGIDQRGRELEIIGVERPAEDLMLIIHVMPTHLRKE